MNYREKIRENKREYECIKAIAKTLRTEFDDMTAVSYGYCCGSDYWDGVKLKTDCVGAKLFKGGMNNDYCYEEKMFCVGGKVYYYWDVTKNDIEDIIRTMQRVADEYSAKVSCSRLENGNVNPNKCLLLDFGFEFGEVVW